MLMLVRSHRKGDDSEVAYRRAMNKELTLREHLGAAGVSFLLAAALPRLDYLLRWPTRLGPRGLLVYVAWNTLLLFGIRSYLLPYAKRMADEHDRLKERLGREPTVDDLAEHFGWPPARE
jgi:hypothetical protein